MLKNILLTVVFASLITSCSGDKSVKVTSLQKKDKNLSCNEIQLEINEAEFYRRTAEKNKDPDIKSLLMPLGYISTYVDAGEAVNAAEARINYLNRIYDILDCDNPAARGQMTSKQAFIPNSGYNPRAYYQPQSLNRATQYAPVENNQGQTYYNSEEYEEAWYY